MSEVWWGKMFVKVLKTCVKSRQKTQMFWSGRSSLLARHRSQFGRPVGMISAGGLSGQHSSEYLWSNNTTNMTADAAKTKKAAKPKAPAAHPKYSVMIAAAIAALKDRTGSSRQAILKYICANYKVDAAKAAGRVRLALKKLVTSKAIVAAAAAGKKGAGSFKLAEKPKAAKPVKAKKKPAAKKAKKPAAKKPAAKKPAAKKAKKPAAKKPAAKKPAAKKPAAKKPAAKAKKPAKKVAPKKK